MTQSAKERSEKKVKRLIVELKTDYPNLYNSMGGRYVRQFLKDMYFSLSKRRL